ncbi:hypothetical protein F5887DRAFT_27454 [Amanita rubescens]|nr:hypothetical protein F5887DRAFT_27454 [Amanita rubescens]
MGSASSQIVRRAVKPSAVGTPKPRQPSSSAVDPITGNSRSVAHDDQDAHFIANIKRLGPVHVYHHDIRSALKSPHSPEQTVFESRVPNLSMEQSVLALPVHRLHELLDRRKNATSPSSLASLVESYGVDQGLLGQLASVVNSPSVRAGTGVQHVRTDTGEETFSTIALWVNSRIDQTL